jgi:hypothetical protein
VEGSGNGGVNDDAESQNGNNQNNGGNNQNNGGNNQNNNGNNQNGNGNNNNQNGGDNNNQAYDPYEDFDIAQCDTFENLWLWDLSLTCESETNLDSCECVFAEELMASGYIACDDRFQCPLECKICKTCFQLMGCDTSNSFVSSGGFIYLMLTLVSIFLLGFAYYYFRVRHKKNDLAVNLMADDDTSSGESKIWLAPVKFSDSDVIECIDVGNMQNHVWLAPVLPSIDISSSHEVVSSNESISSAEMLLPCQTGDLKHVGNEGDNVWLAPIDG